MGVEPSGDRVKALFSGPSDENGQVPPPPPSDVIYLSLPPGWAATTSHDGRTYYWEMATGKTSWTLPSAPMTYQPNVAMAPAHAVAPTPPFMPSQQPVNVTSTKFMDRGRSGIIASRSMKDSDNYDHAMDAASGYSQRPTTHKCYAIVATILFFPLGLFALIYSLKVESAWDASRIFDSFRYSRRALLFSRAAITFGAVFWIWFLFFRGPEGIDFDFHFRPFFER
jgi:hypothetical protein